MAINFGQQINQALDSSLNRVGDSRVRARQLAEQMRKRQFNQQLQQQVQQLKERQFQLSREAQTEEIMNRAMQRNLERDREERLGKLTDARISNLNSEDGVNPSSLISGLQSLLTASTSELDAAGTQREEKANELSTLLNAPSQTRSEDDNERALTARENDDVDTGWFDFTGVDPSDIEEAEQELATAKQDSAAAQEQLNPLVEEEEAARENVQEIRNTLQSLIKSIRGESPGDDQEESQNNAPLDNL